MTQDPLRDELAAIATLLDPAGISLILGGGYGLVLRGRVLDAERRESRYELRLPTRATADLDLYLSVAILTDPSKTRRIAEVLHERGFSAVEHNWQFAKPMGASGAPQRITVDLLGADVSAELAHLMHHAKDDRLIRPEGFAGLHARRVPEAVSIERYATKLDVGTDSNPAFVLIPHPISFLLMKLAAFRDRIGHADD